MSLSRKLEQDHLRDVCEGEVQELHQLFVSWFQGKRPQNELVDELNSRLETNFSHVAPNGQFLQGRNVLIGHLQDKFGCYRDRVFQIDIHAVQLLWHFKNQISDSVSQEMCLCTYEEWQSWQQEEESTDVHQFGRLSTCLLVKHLDNNTSSSGGSGSNSNSNSNSSHNRHARYKWVHVHETWLEADAPSHPPKDKTSYGDDDDDDDDDGINGYLSATSRANGGDGEGGGGDNETIMTGPVEYDKMHQQQQQPQETSPGTVVPGQVESETSDTSEKDQDEDDHDNDDGIESQQDNGDDDEDSGENEDSYNVAEKSSDAVVVAPLVETTLPVKKQDEPEKPNAVLATSTTATAATATTTRGAPDTTIPTSPPREAVVATATTATTTTTSVSSPARSTATAASVATPTTTTTTSPSHDATVAAPRQPRFHVIEKPKTDILTRLPLGLVVLMSTQVLSREQMARQEQVASILNHNNYDDHTGRIDYFALDGSLKEEREVRNKLFSLSKAGWGKYPQFFVVYKQEKDDGNIKAAGSSIVDLDDDGDDDDDDDGVTVVSYWGDYDAFLSCHEKGDLKHQLEQPHSPMFSTTVSAAATAAAATATTPTLAIANNPASPLSSSPSSTSVPDAKQVDETLVVEAIAACRSNPNATAAAADEQRALDALNTASLQVLLLVSSQSLARDQQSRQDNAKTLLHSFQVPFTTLDGANHLVRNTRNALFKKSKMWGVYPQLFIIVDDNFGSSTVGTNGASLKEDLSQEDMDDAMFWGAWDKLYASSNTSTLVQDLATLAVPDWNYGSNNENNDQTAVSGTSNETDKDISDDGSLEEKDVTRPEQQRPQEQPQQQKEEPKKQTAFSSKALSSAPSDEHDNDENESGQTEQPQPRQQQQSVQFESSKAKVMPPLAHEEEYDDDEEDDDEEEHDPTEGILFFEDSEHGDDNNNDNKRKEQEEEDEEYDNPEEQAFMQASQGILEFEEEEEDDDNGKKNCDGNYAEEKLRQVAEAASPIPHDASGKRHVSPMILKYAKPLTWENTLVGISIAGFDIGTSQGPMGDETWYKEVGEGLEMVSQPLAKVATAKPTATRKISLPEMVFPTAHVALEGHGYWLSWDVLDALEDWARAHQEIPVLSDNSYRGVGVLKSKDAALWAAKQKSLSPAAAAASGASSSASAPTFHYDWTFSTPFAGKVEGGTWIELDESGMRVELLTDKSAPILFFDEIVLFEDDLHDNGQVEYSAKLRVMPSCAYVLARFWLRVDGVLLRLRETRLLVDFFGMKPAVYRDVTWRECAWQDLAKHGLPTDVRDWRLEGRETQAWHNLLARIPEVDPPNGIYKYAMLEACMDDPNASLRNIHGDDD